MSPRIAITAVVALAALGFHAAAARAADNYKIDSEHAAVIFKVDHLGVAPAYGRFNDPTGTVVLDKEDASKSSFTFEVKTDNIDTDNDKRDAHLKDGFFESKQFPTITFKSTAVKAAGENKYEVTGDLNLHGVTKPITFTIAKTGEKDTGKMGYRTGWATTVTLKRSDYGIKTMIGPIGDEVELNISFEAVKS
jgi:polyisoprenoid-binding protein YceI